MSLTPAMHIIYMITEGFEASSKADMYDVCIFALSTIRHGLKLFSKDVVRAADTLHGHGGL